MTRWASRPAPDTVMLAARILLGLVALVVAAIVFTPGPPDAGGQEWLRLWLIRVHRTWMPGWISFGLIEFASNVVMFAPLGLLGALAVRRRRFLVIPVCVAFSAVTELVQWIALPQRDGSVQDVLANAIGAALGYLVALLVLRRCARGKRKRSITA